MKTLYVGMHVDCIKRYFVDRQYISHVKKNDSLITNKLQMNTANICSFPDSAISMLAFIAVDIR